MTDFEKLQYQKRKEALEEMGIHNWDDYEKAVAKMKPLNLAIMTCGTAEETKTTEKTK